MCIERTEVTYNPTYSPRITNHHEWVMIEPEFSMTGTVGSPGKIHTVFYCKFCREILREMRNSVPEVNYNKDY